MAIDLEKTKMQVKSAMKTAIDSVLNDAIGQLKVVFGNTVDNFFDTLWAPLIKDVSSVAIEAFKKEQADQAAKKLTESKKILDAQIAEETKLEAAKEVNTPVD